MAQGASLWKLPAPAVGSNLLQPQQRTRRQVRKVQLAQDGGHDIGLLHPQGLPPQPAPVHPQAQSPSTIRLHQSEAEKDTERHSMQLRAQEEAPAGSGLSSTSPARHLEATSGPRQRGQAPSRRGSRGQPFVRSVYRWPRWRDIHDRPQFLEQYPCRDGQMYNVNSFLGKLDPRGGKYYVPPRHYAKFLEEYHQALEDGYLLFLTENYHTQPFRFFMELDFDWEVPDVIVEEVLPQIIDTIIRTAQEFYQLPARPFHVISMRTIHKVHLNFPDIITTELLAHMCRDRVIAACREMIGSQHTDWLDLERVVDFSHGSFRLMGSHKPRHIQRDPPWVYDKAYYKVKPRPNEEGKPTWVPGKIWLQTLMWSSIFPTKSQIRQFEASPAFLDMIYQDLSADQARMEERLRGRLLRTQQMIGEGTEGNEHGRDASNQVDLEGVATSSSSSSSSGSSSSDSSAKPAQDVKLTLKVMPWGEVKAWLRPTRRLEKQPRPKQVLPAEKQRRQEALEFAQARCMDSRFAQLVEVANSAESLRWQLKGVQQRVAALSREATEAEAVRQSSKSRPPQLSRLPSKPIDPGHGSHNGSGSKSTRNDSWRRQSDSQRRKSDNQRGESKSQHGQSDSQLGRSDSQHVQNDSQHGHSFSCSSRQTRGSTGPGSGQESAVAVYSTSFGSVDEKGAVQLQVSADGAAQESTGRPAQISTDRAARVPTDKSAQVSTDRAAGVSTDRPAQVPSDRATGVNQSCAIRESSKSKGSSVVEVAGSDMADFAAKAGAESSTQRSRAAGQQPQHSRETPTAQWQQPQHSRATETVQQGKEPSQTDSQSLCAGQSLSHKLTLPDSGSGVQGTEIIDEESGCLSSGGEDHVPLDGNSLSLAEEKQALLADLKRQEKALQRRFAPLQLQVNAALDSLSEELRGV